MVDGALAVWGLTGNIACGKSLVERILEEQGVPVVDTDRVAREIVEPGEPALAEIDARFPGVVKDGRLDRAALGAVVFADPAARKDLEAITHPRIFARTAEHVMRHAAAGHTLVVVSAALMVETGSYRNYAGLLVVTCPPETQLERLLARDGFTEEDARRRIAAQMPQGEKAAHADTVIDNGGTPEETRSQVLAWLEGLEGPRPG